MSTQLPDIRLAIQIPRKQPFARHNTKLRDEQFEGPTLLMNPQTRISGTDPKASWLGSIGPRPLTRDIIGQRLHR